MRLLDILNWQKGKVAQTVFQYSAICHFPEYITIALTDFNKKTNVMSTYVFYDNCRNSRALVGYIFYCQYADRHEFPIFATRQRARAGNSTIFFIVKNKLISVFNASVQLLTMNSS